MRDIVNVVFEDSEFLVLNKPAGLVCHPTKGDVYSSLISRVRLYLGAADSEPHMINRLDRETSGLVVVAKNWAAAVGLRKIWEGRSVQKTYLAIVHGHAAEKYRVIDAPLGKDELSPVAIKDCVRPDGTPARTEYWRERCFENERGAFSLLRVVPYTGRKHQIRIHLAFAGHPIVGDKLYGADENLYLALVEGRLTEEQRRYLILPYHALHAGELRFDWEGGERVFRAGPESWFNDFLSEETRKTGTSEPGVLR